MNKTQFGLGGLLIFIGASSISSIFPELGLETIQLAGGAITIFGFYPALSGDKE